MHETLDPRGHLRREYVAFQDFKNKFGSLTVRERYHGYCPVSVTFDVEGNAVEYCSVQTFSRLLDSDDCTLNDRAAQKKFAWYVRIKRFGRPDLRYTDSFRKSGCPWF